MYSCYLFHLTLLETFEATFDSFVFFIFGPESLEWSFDLRVCCFSDWKIVFQTIQTRLFKPGLSNQVITREQGQNFCKTLLALF